MKKKELYEAPEVETYDVVAEGVICESPNGYHQGGGGNYTNDINDNGEYV